MSGTNLYRTPYSATAGTTPQYRTPKFDTGATNPYAYGYAASAGANATQPNTGGGMPTNYGAGVRPPAPAPVPQQTTQQSMSQGASPYSAGYTPLQYQTGQNQDAFIQQQQAAFQQWLTTPAGMAWQQAQPQQSQWFGQVIHPTPTPVPQTAGWSPGTGWGMYSNPQHSPGNGGPRQGQFSYGYQSGAVGG